MKEQQELVRILEEFHRLGIHKHMVLIGSWCLLVYSEAYHIPRASFTTNDVDFSVRNPKQIPNLSIYRCLVDLGYDVELDIFGKSKRFVPAKDAFENRLNIDFLCKHGRNLDEPTPFKNLGITLIPLAYQEYLLANPIELKFQGTPVNVPTPEVWAIHKTAVSQLRKGQLAAAKRGKDLANAKIIIDWLGEQKIIAAAKRFPSKKFTKYFQNGLAEIKQNFPF